MDNIRDYGEYILINGRIEEIVIDKDGISYKVTINRVNGDPIIGWFREKDFVKDSSQNVSS